MASKRTKSYALVQAHLNEEDYIKLGFICKFEDCDMTNAIRNLIRERYGLLTDEIDQEVIIAHTDSVRASIINSAKGEKKEMDRLEETYEPKKDCFAYREGRFDSSKRECACLTEMICVNKGRCPFYKKKGGEKNG